MKKKINEKEKKEVTKKPKIKKGKKETTTKEISKKNIIIFYSIILILDITFIIYFAKHNIVNYVSLPGNEIILVNKNKDLLFGRNYISLILSAFFYIYTLLCNKFLLNIKNTKKIAISMFLFYLILNILLFYLFTQKIY